MFYIKKINNNIFFICSNFERYLYQIGIVRMIVKSKFLPQLNLKIESFMRLITINRIMYFLLAVFLLTSCSKKIKQNLVLEPITLAAEGPYFEGPNSFQGKIDSDLNQFLQLKEFTKEQINDIKIVKAIVFLDSLAINIQDLTLQVVSEKESMQKVAFINPLTQANENIQLLVAQEQKDLAPYFLEGGTLVLDANFMKEIDQNMSFKVSLELEITINP